MTARAIHMGALALLLVAGCQETSAIESKKRPIVATIEGIPIYADEFVQELKRLSSDEEGSSLPSVAGQQAQKRVLINDLVARRLLLLEAEKQNVMVSIEEVDSTYKRGKLGWKDEEFAGFLRKRDMTPTEYKNMVREMLTIRRLLTDHIFSRIAVTDEEIEDYIEKHPEVEHVQEQVWVKQILVKTAEEAEDILRDLRRKLTFEEAAIKHSLSPEGKKGGDMGWFARGSLPKVFDEVCFDLRPGQTSKVVASDYGFHIFKVIEHRPEMVRPKEQVRSDVERLLRNSKEREAQQKKVEELRTQSKVTIHEELIAQLP